MRILLVNHTFPPASWAGSEICVLRTAQELQRRGHEVHVFTRDASPEKEEYALSQDAVEGVPVTRITKNFRYAPDFDSIFRDDVLAARFGDWVGGLQPDLVHFHHLTNLSTTLTRELQCRSVPAVMTLHDYWLHCQRGQLLTRTLQRCDGPSVSGCRDCLAVQALRGKAQRLVGGLVSRARRFSTGQPPATDLVSATPERVETPDPAFVQNLEIELGGVRRWCLQVHPPSRVAYQVTLGGTPKLDAAFGMFAPTFEQPGDGVRFGVTVDGQSVLSEFVDAKRNPAQRKWIEARVDLSPWAGQTVTVELETAAEPSGNIDFCAAGWGELTVHGPADATQPDAASERSLTSRVKSLGLNAAARAAAAVFPSATHAILRRRRAILEVLDEIDLFISPSRYLRDFFIHHGLDSEKILFLDNGFEPFAGAAAPARSPGLLRFGYIGTWIPSKGVHLLVEAFNGLPAGRAELHLYGFFPGFDGYEHYESQLRASARHPDIHFRGAYAADSVYEILSGLDAIVVPSIWWENSPLTIHEALQAGVPVITADVGGMAEFVPDGVAGLQFRHRDAASLRAVLQRTLDEPALLSRLRENLPAVLSTEAHTDRLVEIYERVIREKRHSWKQEVRWVE